MSSDRFASAFRARGEIAFRIFLGVVQIAAIVWFSPGKGLPLDDAWIHQVVARTFAESGTLGYAPGHHGAGATSYLWAALLAINFKIAHVDPSRWALALNSLAALAGGQALYALLLEAGPEDGVRPADWRMTALVATTFAWVSPNVVWFVCSGMEAVPFAALSLVATWAASSSRSSRPLLAGVAAGALALLRPEAAPLGALLVGYAFARSRKVAPAAAIGIPWLGALALYFGSNLALNGQAIPSTLAGRRWLWLEMSAGLSRPSLALGFVDAWASRLATYTLDTSLGVVWMLVAVAAYGALRLVRRAPAPGRDGVRLLFAWAFAHAAFYAVLLPTPGHGGRYQPLTPLLFAVCLSLGIAFALRDLVRVVLVPPDRQPPRFGWFAGAGVVLAISLAAPALGNLREANALAVAHIEGTELAAGSYVRQLPEGPVASFDIGGIGWVSRRPILDLGGLSDPQTAKLLETGRLAGWLESNRVRWIVLPQTFERVLPVFADYRTRLHLRHDPQLHLEAVRVFETPADRWSPAIRATWNAEPKQIVYEVSYPPSTMPRPEASAPAPRLPGAGATSSISDEAGLLPAGDRALAERQFAILAAAGLAVEVTVTPSAPPRPHAPPPSQRDGRCRLAIGAWGVAIDACPDAGHPRGLHALAFEYAERYLDGGDLGGALLVMPQVLVEARQRVDPSFDPPITPARYPVPGGVHVPPLSASGKGLLLVFLMFFSLVAAEFLERRKMSFAPLASALIAKIGARSVAAASAIVLLVGAAPSCGPAANDMGAAMAHGRGAVELALAAGASVDEDKNTHWIPLLAAAGSGDAEMLSLLLGHGASVEVRGRENATPLHLAARAGHPAAALVLLSAPGGAALLDLPAGPRRRTALQDAVASPETIAVLLAAGADPNVADSFGQTALHLVAPVDAARAERVAEALLDAGADPEAVDARGFTPLHAAAAADDVGLLRALLRRRPDLVDLASARGETALRTALRYESDRTAEVLLAAGADLPRGDFWPPLHQAARTDALERAANLLAVTADLARRVRGKTALDIAREHRSTRVEALLRGAAETHPKEHGAEAGVER